MKDQNHLSVRIADIVLSVFSDWSMGGPASAGIRLEESYRDFLCTGEPEVTVRTCYGGMPQIPLRHEDRVFDSESLWSLYQIPSCAGIWRNIFVLRSPISGPLPYRIAVFDADFTRGEVYDRMTELRDTSDGFPIDIRHGVSLLEFPLSELLIMCLLARGRGLMVHSCGIDDGGQGYLFAGNSTHGKTTMARFWKDQAVVLNDDRIVLRQREGRFWMYGTPWHGDYTGVSPQGVPVERIFFLQHAGANAAQRVEGAVAASMLLSRSFLPLWDAEGIRFTLEFCTQLVADVPCYELGFVPDDSVVDFVRGFNH